MDEILSSAEIDEYYIKDDKHVLKTWSRLSNAPILTGGKGIYFWDASGRRFMDLRSQLTNVNIGYGHKKVIKAIQRQLEQMPYISAIYRSIPTIKLAEQLVKLTPGDMGKCFFTCGGGAAIESAIKISKQYNRRSKVISLWQGYHGSTLGALSATGITGIRTPFEPLLPGFLHVPPPYCRYCSFNLQYPDCNLECARFVEEVIKREDPKTISAFISEPIISNSFVIPPKDYWTIIRGICDKYEINLIFDEVITGFGRTGKMFGCENFNVTPDILVSGKGITSGYLPLGVAIINKKIADYFDDHSLLHGFTYSGHPTCCVAGLAGIQVILEEKLVENARKIGVYLLNRLKELEVNHKSISDVRGLGLLAGFDLNDLPSYTVKKGISEKNISKYMRDKGFEKGIAIGISSSFSKGIVRMVPPLCITQNEVEVAIKIIDEILCDLDSKFY